MQIQDTLKDEVTHRKTDSFLPDDVEAYPVLVTYPSVDLLGQIMRLQNNVFQFLIELQKIREVLFRHFRDDSIEDKPK